MFLSLSYLTLVSVPRNRPPGDFPCRNSEARLAALEHRVGELEDINAIRRLHWAYGYYIDFNRAEDVVQLFARDGAAVFLSGEYRGHEGVRRLYGTWFQNDFTQGVNGPVYGLLLDHFEMQEIITVTPDRQTAKGRFRGLLMGGSHESREYKPEGLPRNSSRPVSTRTITYARPGCGRSSASTT